MAADVLHASRDAAAAGAAPQLGAAGRPSWTGSRRCSPTCWRSAGWTRGWPSWGPSGSTCTASSTRAVEAVRGSPTRPARRSSCSCPTGVYAEVDPRRVERIVRNLVANAIDHGEGRPVEIDAGAATSTRSPCWSATTASACGRARPSWCSTGSGGPRSRGPGAAAAAGWACRSASRTPACTAGWLQAWGELGPRRGVPADAAARRGRAVRDQPAAAGAGRPAPRARGRSRARPGVVDLRRRGRFGPPPPRARPRGRPRGRRDADPGRADERHLVRRREAPAVRLCWRCCSSSPGSPAARACPRARRCRCCARSATATRRCCRPVPSTAATRSTWCATSSSPPAAARPARRGPPLPRPRGRRLGRRRGPHRARRAVRHRLPHRRSTPSADIATIRIRGTALGRLTPAGCVRARRRRRSQQDVTVVRRDGQWRIPGCPTGSVVPLSDLPRQLPHGAHLVRRSRAPARRRRTCATCRACRRGPRRRGRWSCCSPGPSGGAAGRGVEHARRRTRSCARTSPTSPDGALIVDLTQVGDLDEAARRLLAAQVVLSLAEVNVGRVRLLVDGEPLLPGRPDLTRDDVAALSPSRCRRRRARPGRLAAAGCASSPGRSRAPPLPGPLGNGELRRASRRRRAVDGRRLAVVAARARAGRCWSAAPRGGRRAGAARRGHDDPAVVGADRLGGLDGRWTPRSSPGCSSTPTAPPRTGRGRRRRADRARARSRTCGCPATACGWSRWSAVGSTRRGGPQHRRRGRDPQHPPRCARRTSARWWRRTGGRPSRSWRSAAAPPSCWSPRSPWTGSACEPVLGNNLTPPLTRGRRGVEPAAAGDRPGRGLELRRRRPGRVAPGAGRRARRGAALPRLTAAPGSYAAGRAVDEPARRLATGSSVARRPVHRRSRSRARLASWTLRPTGSRGPARACCPHASCWRRWSISCCPATARRCGAPAPWCAGCAARLGPPLRPVLPGGPAVLAAGRYTGPLRTALLRYKERGRRDLAGPLAELLAAPLRRAARRAGAETWLVPAPSRPAAARARGGDHVAAAVPRLAAGRPGCGSRRRCGWPGGPATRWGSTPRSARRTSPAGCGCARPRVAPGAAPPCCSSTTSSPPAPRCGPAARRWPRAGVRARRSPSCCATPRVDRPDRGAAEVRRSATTGRPAGAFHQVGSPSAQDLLPNRDARYRAPHRPMPLSGGPPTERPEWDRPGSLQRRPRR